VWAKAVNGAGTSPFSRSVMGKPSAATAIPLTPTSLTVTVKNKRLDLSWTSVSGASSYKVYYHTENSAVGRTELPAIPHTPGKVGAVIRELKNDTLYYIWVYASNNVGDSASAATGNGSPKAKPPLDYALSRIVGYAADKIEMSTVSKLTCESAIWFSRENYGDQSPSGDIDFFISNTGLLITTLGGREPYLNKGEITCASIRSVIWDDAIWIISMKGSDVIAMFNYSFTTVNPKAYLIASKEIEHEKTLATLTFNKAPIEPEKIYIIAASDYVVQGFDGHIIVKEKATVLSKGLEIWKAVAAYIYDQEDPIVPW
jgi:hypothetical protein